MLAKAIPKWQHSKARAIRVSIKKKEKGSAEIGLILV